MSYLASTTCAADGTITTFVLDGEDLSPKATSPIGKGVSAMALDHSDRRAYVSLKQPTGVATIDLDQETGTWTTSSHHELPSHPSYLRVSEDGGLLLGADYGAGLGLVWPIQDDGSLGEPTDRIHFERLHCVVQHDQFVYFVSLGEDLVACYRLTEDGQLQPLAQPTVACPAGSGPRHAITSADGRTLYVVTEFSGEVLRFARDVASGQLELVQQVAAHATDRGLKHSVIDEDPLEHHYVWGADLHLAGPEGRWLLVSERTESTLAVLPVADDGTLADPVSLADVSTQPRGFVVTPDEQHALVPGEKATVLQLWRIDDRGQLAKVAEVPNDAGANWARITQL